MNRLILVGNGFDLAKGLESSYQHFIDWMWKTIIDTFIKKRLRSYEDQFVIINSIYEPNSKTTYNYKTLKEFISTHGSINVKNKFLETISEKAHSSWVDIETEYFNELKNILQGQSEKTIEKLNNDFEEIKLELQKYLTSQLENFELTPFKLANISEQFNLLDFTSKGVDEFEKEYKSKIGEDLFLLKKESIKQGDYFYCNTDTFPQNLLFLNFNYTPFIPALIETFQKSHWPLNDWRKSKMEYLYIHGELNNEGNPIIFGYGDENDELQNEIEKRGGDFLNNIKTINYLKTPNYKKVLSFLDSDNYQVFIMGHSCGLSDKTLLKTIFEHPKCISIRPFYYTDEEGNNNYNDIVRNIYRTFTDKALMRDKVVNEKYCCELKV